MSAPKWRLVSIFEALNESIREIYLGMTALTLDQLAAAHTHKLPASIAHWRKDHGITYKCLERSVPIIDAPTFIASHAQCTRSGYKLIVDR